MRLDPSGRKDRPESIVPMINVVFLLLIFFLMSATLAPPDPLEAIPPAATSEAEPSGGAALVIDAQGRLAFGNQRADAAIAAAAASGVAPLRLRADQDAPAARLIEVVQRLTAAGIENIRLTALPREERPDA